MSVSKTLTHFSDLSDPDKQAIVSPKYPLRCVYIALTQPPDRLKDPTCSVPTYSLPKSRGRKLPPRLLSHSVPSPPSMTLRKSCILPQRKLCQCSPSATLSSARPAGPRPLFQPPHHGSQSAQSAPRPRSRGVHRRGRPPNRSS